MTRLLRMIKTDSNVTIPVEIPIVHRLLWVSLGANPVLGSVGVGVTTSGVGVTTSGVGVTTSGTVQVGPVIVLASNVTAPVCTKARPFKVAPVFNAIDVSARIFPIKLVVVSRVAELPILHHTLHGSPPVTDEPGDVISVDAVLKIQTPDPVRVKSPVNEKLLVEQ